MSRVTRFSWAAEGKAGSWWWWGWVKGQQLLGVGPAALQIEEIGPDH